MKKILILSLLCVGSYLGAAQRLLASMRSGNIQNVLTELNADSKGDYTPHLLGFALYAQNLLNWQSFEIAQLLIMRGADLDYKDSITKGTLLSSFARHGYRSGQEAEIFELLLQQKASVNLGDHSEDTPLHHAIRWSQEGVVKLLLKHQASVTLVNHKGETPLTVEVYSAHEGERNEKIIQLLAQYKDHGK